MPQKGTVQKWLNHKGIGFITLEGQESEEGKDILVHYSQIKQESEDGFKSLQQGSAVEFELEDDPKDPSKKVQVNVTGPDGQDCEKKVRRVFTEEEKQERQERKGKGKGKKGKGKGKKGKGKKGKGKGKKGDDEEDEE